MWCGHMRDVQKRWISVVEERGEKSDDLKTETSIYQIEGRRFRGNEEMEDGGWRRRRRGGGQIEGG